MKSCLFIVCKTIFTIGESQAYRQAGVLSLLLGCIDTNSDVWHKFRFFPWRYMSNEPVWQSEKKLRRPDAVFCAISTISEVQQAKIFLYFYITWLTLRKTFPTSNTSTQLCPKGRVRCWKISTPSITRNYGYKKLYRQRKNLICNAVAGKALISLVIARGITLNPFVLASLTAFGIIVIIKNWIIG